MKKLYILITLLLVTFGLSAQEFYGGVLAGFNGSQIDHDGAGGYHKMGLVGGAWVQRDLSPNWYWGMELKVNQKGMRIKPTKENNQKKYIYRLNYIDLPMLIGYTYDTRFSFFGGFSFGYLFNKHGIDNYGVDSYVEYDNITNWEAGMFAGIKTDFKELVKRDWAQNFSLEVRFQYSLVSIDQYHDFFTQYSNSIGKFNNVISTVLYYQIEWGN
ncbi:MAG: PorT family protein [Prolixibacteraceae bacterium]|nr:PorT family protein [Prolixibacteraceae bacterium]